MLMTEGTLGDKPPRILMVAVVLHFRLIDILFNVRKLIKLFPTS
jgi:hypothetical protein